MYRQIEYKAGAVLEIIKCIPKGCRKGMDREPVPPKSKEEIQEANMRQAARRLARKINANFHPGDWHITLTYKKEERPDQTAAQKILSNFMKNVRKEFTKMGYPCKYILVTEYMRKAIHHHLIINNINDGKKTTAEIVRKLWKGCGTPKFIALYDDGEYSQLAEYLIKETEKTFREEGNPTKQRYSCSRNLITPKPEVRMKKAKTWKQDPKPRPGYYVVTDSLYNGFDKLGYPYQRYLMVKLEVEDSDWTDGSSWPG